MTIMSAPSDKPNEGSHHHKEFEIVVNGRAKTVTTAELSYEEVVRLAFDDAFQNSNTIYTVTYKRGTGAKPEGGMVAGESVKTKAGMIFNVFHTTRS
jgi:predicted enzyme related to lactoylglutathione lyase